MLRKTLIMVTAISALCVGSTAMAAHMSSGRAAPMGGGIGGPTMHGGPMTAAPMTRGPMTTGPIQGWNGRTAWGHFHNHFHHRFRHRTFFAFGFGGPVYDYAYSCWTQVPTRHGWRWVYVCGDYGYY
jgi:hypothetical protein